MLLSVLTFSTFSIFSSSKSNAAETVFECLACPAGQACGDGIEPTPCPAGTYAIQGSSKCVSCLNTGVATCDATNGKATNCKAGYGFDSSNGTCSICSVGTYSAGGTGACKSCSDVTYSSWSASCGSATQTKTTYCTKIGSTTAKANPSSTTETKNMGGCGAHQYCDGSCKTCSKPANSSWSDNSSCSWTCDTGYAKNGNSCTACSKPSNSHWTSGCSWACDSGYTSYHVSGKCCKQERKQVYETSSYCKCGSKTNTYTGSVSVCPDGTCNCHPSGGDSGCSTLETSSGYVWKNVWKCD